MHDTPCVIVTFSTGNIILPCTYNKLHYILYVVFINYTGNFIFPIFATLQDRPFNQSLSNYKEISNCPSHFLYYWTYHSTIARTYWFKSEGNINIFSITTNTAGLNNYTNKDFGAPKQEGPRDSANLNNFAYIIM